MKYKTCNACNQEKPFFEYHRQSAAKDGRQARCKDCACHLARQWHYDNPRVDAMPTSGRKTCTGCGEEKSIMEFYRRRASVDGLMPCCKSCDNKRRLAGKPSARNSKVAPQQRMANTAVGNAVRDRRLEKAGCCTRCGSRGRLEAHHGDYGKAFEVEWLCGKCHGLEHFPREDMAHLL